MLITSICRTATSSGGTERRPFAWNRNRSDERSSNDDSAKEPLMLGTFIIGILAGWLAGKLMRGSGYGIIGDLVLGLVGGVVGGWLFRDMHVRGPNGAIGALVVATIGAVVLVGIAHTIRRI